MTRDRPASGEAALAEMLACSYVQNIVHFGKNLIPSETKPVRDRRSSPRSDRGPPVLKAPSMPVQDRNLMP
jgi:hypothetical protein